MVSFFLFVLLIMYNFRYLYKISYKMQWGSFIFIKNVEEKRDLISKFLFFRTNEKNKKILPVFRLLKRSGKTKNIQWKTVRTEMFAKKLKYAQKERKKYWKRRSGLRKRGETKKFESRNLWSIKERRKKNGRIEKENVWNN